MNFHRWWSEAKDDSRARYVTEELEDGGGAAVELLFIVVVFSIVCCVDADTMYCNKYDNNWQYFIERIKLLKYRKENEHNIRHTKYQPHFHPNQ